MAQADWAELGDNASQSVIKHAVIRDAAVPGGGPPGGSGFVYACNSVTNAAGCVGLYTSINGFAPVTKGCDVRGAIQRGISGGSTGFSAWLFAQLQGSASTYAAYALGLSDGGDAAHLVLQRALLSGGMPDNAPGTGASGTLQRSTRTYAPGTWVQIRLEVVLNTNGDVVVNCYQNDLTAGGASVATPSWVAIPGISRVIDDAVGANVSNELAQAPTNPLSPGLVGFGMQSSNVSRRAYFTRVEVEEQQ